MDGNNNCIFIPFFGDIFYPILNLSTYCFTFEGGARAGSIQNYSRQESFPGEGKINDTTCFLLFSKMSIYLYQKFQLTESN